MEDLNVDIDSWIQATLARNSMTASQAVAQGLADAISNIHEEPRSPGKSKPSDILGMSAASAMDSWTVRGYTTTTWIDDLIEESRPKPSTKSLGIPKAKHD